MVGNDVVKTISRDELKAKIDRGDQFLLIETLPATAFHHAHLPGAINLPPDQVKQSAANFMPDKHIEMLFIAPAPPDTLQKTLPVNWRRSDTLTVRDYADGKSDWIDAGLRTESEHKH